MKKLLLLLSILALSFALIACEEDPIETNPTETTPVITYVITFNTNGGSSIASLTVNENALISVPANPTKEGYTFDGWFTDQALLTPLVTTTPISSNLTVYAKWALIPATEVSVTMIDELLINYHIYTHITIDYTFETDADETQFIHQLADQIYLDYFDEIDGNLYYLTIYVYDQVGGDIIDTYSYQINSSLDQPGLTVID